MTTTSGARLRASDITITRRGIVLYKGTDREEFRPVAQFPASRTAVTAEDRRIACALRDWSFSGYTKKTRADAIEAAEKRLDEARAEAAEATGPAQDICSWVAERIGLDAKDVDEDMIGQMRPEYDAEANAAAAAVEKAERALKEAREADDDEVVCSRDLRELRNEVMARCADYMYKQSYKKKGDVLVTPSRMGSPFSPLERIADARALKSWLGDNGVQYRELKQNGYTVADLFSNLMQNAPRVRQVGVVPHVPPLPEYHYICLPPLPPSPGYAKLNKGLDFHLWGGKAAMEKAEAEFARLIDEGAGEDAVKEAEKALDDAAKAYEVNRALGAAMTCAPMAGLLTGEVPVFRLRSPGNGGGKSKIVEWIDKVLSVCRELYKGEGVENRGAVHTVAPPDAEEPTPKESAEAMAEGMKNLADKLRDGIDVRALHFENPTGKAFGNRIAQIVTGDKISQRAVWGDGSLDLSNHMMVVVTANELELPTDVACRVVCIDIDQAPRGVDGEGWRRKRNEYAEANAAGIRGDICGILAKGREEGAAALYAEDGASRDGDGEPVSVEGIRFKEFTRYVLWPVCRYLMGDGDGSLFRACVAKMNADQLAEDAGTEYGDAVEAAIEDRFLRVDRDSERYSSAGGELSSGVYWVPLTVVRDICKELKISFASLADAAKTGKCDCLYYIPKRREPTDSAAKCYDGQKSIPHKYGFYFFSRDAGTCDDGAARLEILDEIDPVRDTGYKKGLAVIGDVFSKSAGDIYREHFAPRRAGKEAR